MNDQTRRDFLKRLARGAAYAAPVVLTVTAPAGLLAQGQSSLHKPGGSALQQAPATDSPYAPPPGRTPPPGGDPPGRRRPNP